MQTISSQKLVESEAPPKTPYTKRFDYDGSGNLIYEGFAWAAGNFATSVANWAVKKYTYNGSNQLTLVQWANGASTQNNIWDNRAALSYS